MAIAKKKLSKKTVAKPPKAAVGKNGPNLAYLKEMAKRVGVDNFSRKNKTELIRAIQTCEGNSDCYGRIVDCDLSGCLFYNPCQEIRV